MRHANLLLSAREGAALAEFASVFFERLQVLTYEARESDNYVDGYYFIGRSADIEFKLMKSDETEHADLPFWIRISAVTRGSDVSIQFVDELANNLIKPSGRKVARLDNFGQVGERRIDY
jgi:hypothetical protein